MNLIINLDKPKGVTSHKVTASVKRILNAKKAGHTGTLDPLATGLLLVCINKATRLASYFSALDKEYRAVMKLGEATDTQDSFGNVVEKTDRFEVGEVAIKNTLKSFEGKILQKPPMFSALKYKGKPLYKYAKKGLDIPREHREVYIHHIELLNIDLPFVSFMVDCSKGTYIRTLCDDAGKKLGVGAHLYELKRTAIGPFRVSDSMSIEELKSIDKNHPQNRGVYTMDRALSWLPELRIRESLVRFVKNGAPVEVAYCPDFPEDLKTVKGIRIKSPDSELLAIGSFSADKNIIKMDVVLGT